MTGQDDRTDAAALVCCNRLCNNIVIGYVKDDDKSIVTYHTYFLDKYGNRWCPECWRKNHE